MARRRAEAPGAAPCAGSRWSACSSSLLHWGLSMILGSLLVRALARREELDMDYRAAGAAAYLGMGSVWAMGLSSSAAQLQANPASMPPALLAITGVIPFSRRSSCGSRGADGDSDRRHAGDRVAHGAAGSKGADRRDLGVVEDSAPRDERGRRGPANGSNTARCSTSLIAALGAVWSSHEFATKGARSRSPISTRTTSCS